MTPIQVAILHCLIRQANQEVKREKILNDAWNGDTEKASNNTLNHAIREIRCIIKHFFDEHVLVTVHGSGYILNVNAELLDQFSNSHHSNDYITNKNPLNLLLMTWHNSVYILSVMLIIIYPYSINIASLVKPLYHSSEFTRVYHPISHHVCNVSFMGNKGAGYHLMRSAKIAEFLSQNKITCKPDTALIVFYSFDRIYEKHYSQKVFFANCDIENSVLVNCANWFITEGL